MVLPKDMSQFVDEEVTNNLSTAQVRELDHCLMYTTTTVTCYDHKILRLVCYLDSNLHYQTSHCIVFKSRYEKRLPIRTAFCCSWDWLV